MMEKSFDGEGLSPAKSGDSMERVTLFQFKERAIASTSTATRK
jgi:hypothetical protein